jgi:hypothetical protein
MSSGMALCANAEPPVVRTGIRRSICARATEDNDKRDKAIEKTETNTLMYDVVGTTLHRVVAHNEAPHEHTEHPDNHERMYYHT